MDTPLFNLLAQLHIKFITEVPHNKYILNSNFPWDSPRIFSWSHIRLSIWVPLKVQTQSVLCEGHSLGMPCDQFCSPNWFSVCQHVYVATLPIQDMIQYSTYNTSPYTCPRTTQQLYARELREMYATAFIISTSTKFWWVLYFLADS